MRVSNNMGYDQVKTNIQKNRSEMGELQNQSATMKRITKPSDDAVGTARMLQIRTDKTGNEQYVKNLDMAKTYLNYTESALADLTELISRAKELAVGQASDASSNAISRMAVATEVEHIFKDAVSIGNRKFGERYIFGGYKTMNSPFDAEGNYFGDDGNIKIEVSKGIYTTMNLPGNEAFNGVNDRLGHVPDNRRGSGTPNYPAPPPAPSEKHVDETAELRGPANKEEQEPKLGIDGQPVDKGEDVFKVLNALANGLRANDTTAIQETLERLDSTLDQAILLRSQVGSRVASLDNTMQTLAKAKVDDATLLSSIEDADAFELFSDITRNENTLKATLQTSGKMIQSSLLDFLR